MRINSRLQTSILMMIVTGSMTATAESPHGLVDPTRPLGDLTTWQRVQSDLILTSVLITEKNRVAVINGVRVVEGQEIDDAEVVSIQPGRVILLRGDRSQELKVHQYNVKHSAVKRSVGEQSVKKSRL
ncbi:MAG: hypothetical protein QGD92_13250 [Gammaproteobacteria bacterium]|nr:hypothetical protein [Gammaproteobacteria bacterium]